FSEAISNKDIHRRIVDLFTIWESLLLKNDSVNIQDSLVLYGTQLLGIKGEDVKIFKSNLMSMYALRSQMVHHAVRKELDLEKVRGFQIETFELIDIMCHHSLAHPTKILLLESVDEFLSKL
ncbi:MAG: HEPN domain-containing protein, partial [Parachlamydiaceae bacterium]|nr:HEPN domain-containing protein [Parachlamydiaceae bacterium]